MRISSNYLQLINRILTEEPGKPTGGSKKISARNKDHTELSGLITGLQKELDRIDAEEGPERAARLKSLAGQIEQGTYNVDSKELASAMLKFINRNSL